MRNDRRTQPPAPSPSDLPVFDVGEREDFDHKEGWANWVRRIRVRPPMLSRARYSRLSSTDRLRYNRARHLSHRDIYEIHTPDMVSAHAEMASHLLGADGSAPVARHGTFLSGYPQAGKTTTANIFARDFERRFREEYPFGTRTSMGAEFIPVCYSCVGKQNTTKGLMKRIYDFYAIPYKDRASGDDLLIQLPEIAYQHGTKLFIFDELHNLSMSNESDLKVSSDIKEMMGSIQASFIGIGVNLDETGLLSEGKRGADAFLAQIGGRFTLKRVRPMQLTSATERKQWSALLRTFEMELQLLNARDGDLSWQLNEYVHHRTGGIMGDITNFLVRGANVAIELGEERLTEGLLEKIPASYLAEVRAGRETPGVRRPRGETRR